MFGAFIIQPFGSHSSLSQFDCSTANRIRNVYSYSVFSYYSLSSFALDGIRSVKFLKYIIRIHCFQFNSLLEQDFISFNGQLKWWFYSVNCWIWKQFRLTEFERHSRKCQKEWQFYEFTFANSSSRCWHFKTIIFK